MKLEKKVVEPQALNLLAINLTTRCNLACAHCYLDAGTLRNHDPDELSTGEVCRLLNQVAARSKETMVVLTGGEPLLRRDIEEIVAHGNQLGLFMVVGTNGMLLTPKRVASLKAAGLQGAGISLDSLDPEYHDHFRGQPGAWEKTLRGIEECRRQDLSFQIHFSITVGNAHELPAVIDFAAQLGARVMNVFFLVCTGRGKELSDISPGEYEKLLHQILEAQERYAQMIIRPRCAPHYKRVALQRDPDATINQISGNEGDGCIAGRHYCRITPHGGVTACPYIEEEVGNIRQKSFITLWDNNVQFKALRKPVLTGKCGDCEYQKLCGGCRARPVSQGLNLMDEDNLCAYIPQGDQVIEPLRFDGQPVRWSAEAEQRIKRVPAFIRKMVKKRAEALVTQRGEPEITCAHLEEMIAKRFGNSSGNGNPRKMFKRMMERNGSLHAEGSLSTESTPMGD